LVFEHDHYTIRLPTLYTRRILLLVYVLFVKAAKAISLGILFIPFTGCAIGVGLIFASLLKSVSYAPDYEEVLFNYAMLGFAFIETFAFLLFFILAVIIAF